MSDLTHSESVVVEASPDAVYALISDVTRTGELSPECKQCWWDEGASGRVGDGFTGRNVAGDHTWDVHCTVIAADPGREFAFSVGDEYARWVYSMQAEGAGTRLTEAWEFLPNGINLFHDMYGDDAEAHIAARIGVAHQGIGDTLAAVKRIAEGG
jgi:hypothetical protein